MKKKDMSVPYIRFSEFTEDWTSHKFKDITKPSGKRNKNGLRLEPYAVTNDRGFIPQSEAHDEFGYMQNVDQTAYIIVPPNSFAYNPARINVGSIGYYSGKKDVIVSSLYEVFKTTDEVDDAFLNQWIQTKTFRDWIYKLQEGSVRLYFYYDKLCEVSLICPSLEEQQKIADFLSSIDEVITANEEEVANLETQKKAVMKKIFSQEVRFKREDGTCFPEWNYKLIGKIANLLSGQDFSPEHYNDIHMGTPYLTGASCIVHGRTTAVRWTETPKCIVEYGDIVIVCKGSGSGTVAIVYQDKAHIARQFMCIRPKEDLLREYCYHQTCYMTEDIRSEAKGTIPGIDRSTILNRLIGVPCLEEQRLIADFLSDFDEAIAAAKKELELWKELKKGLLQQMFV